MPSIQDGGSSTGPLLSKEVFRNDKQEGLQTGSQVTQCPLHLQPCLSDHPVWMCPGPVRWILAGGEASHARQRSPLQRKARWKLRGSPCLLSPL